MRNYYEEMSKIDDTGVLSAFRQDNYYAVHVDSWIFLKNLDSEEASSNGWKFHLSVDGKDTARAWNIVAQKLTEDQGHIHGAKVARPQYSSKFSDPDYGQRGKSIVIHTYPGIEPEHYMKLLEEIEKEFVKQGIQRGLAPASDRNVPGSGYIYYRNGKDENRRALDPSEHYNPTGAADPYASFNIIAEDKILPESLFIRPWQAGKTQGGEQIARVPLIGMTTIEVNELSRDLMAQGLNPRLSHSEKLGPTLRLTGDEAGRIMASQTAKGPKI